MITKIARLFTVVIMFLTGTGLVIPTAYAESNAHLQTKVIHIPEGNSTSLTTDLTITGNQPLSLESQLKQIDDSILFNQKIMSFIEKNIVKVNLDLSKLQNKLTVLNDKIEKRKNILKERALSYQQNGGYLNFLELLLNSSSFQDFVATIGAASQISEADQELLNQQKTDLKTGKNLKEEAAKKVSKVHSMSTQLIETQKNVMDLKRQLEALKNKLKKNKQAQLPTISKLAPKSTAGIEVVHNVSRTNQGNIQTILNAAYKYIGNSTYVFGGGRTSYDVAQGRFDCSGFVHWALAQAGIEVGFSTDSIKNSGQPISVNELQPGDLVFFDTYKKDGHVGIYMGDGKFIGSQCSKGVAIEDMTKGYWKNAFNGHVVRI